MFLRALPRPRPGRVASLSSCSSSSTAAAATQVLKVGDVLRLSRRFSEADVLAYSKVSGDANPVHFDADFARGFAGFRDPVVHGMLVASLFPTIIASHLPGAIYISQTLQFKLPVYVGDEILAEVQPVNVRENKKRYMYAQETFMGAKFLTKCFMVGGEPLVLDGEATAILPTLALNS